MIPKVIHYCWFGTDPIPYSLQKCMQSWGKVLPDYKLRLWSAKDFNMNLLPWTQEAFSQKAMAFVTDYVRLYALYHEGGIYMDTDVLVKKTFDPLLQHGCFTGIEYHPEMIEADPEANTRLTEDGTNRYPGTRVPGLGLQAAILGAEKGHPYLKAAMQFYETHHFLQPDGSWYTKEIAPDILAQAAEQFGLKYDKNITQTLSNDMLILPYTKIAGAYTQVTKETIAVHLSKGGWRKRTILRSLLTKINFYRKIFKSR